MRPENDSKTASGAEISISLLNTKGIDPVRLNTIQNSATIKNPSRIFNSCVSLLRGIPKRKASYKSNCKS